MKYFQRQDVKRLWFYKPTQSRQIHFPMWVISFFFLISDTCAGRLSIFQRCHERRQHPAASERGQVSLKTEVFTCRQRGERRHLQVRSADITDVVTKQTFHRESEQRNQGGWTGCFLLLSYLSDLDFRLVLESLCNHPAFKSFIL